MQIDVTWYDINTARAELAADKFIANSCFCPIALALKRQLSPDVWVYDTYFETAVNNQIKRIELPDIARTFIELFDNGKNVKPISFSIIL